jgi:hypothetical protein
VNLRNVPINDEDLPNFMIESTNREREEVEVQKERIYVSVELLKVRSGRQVPDNVGIANEIRSQTMANGPPLYSLLAFDSPSSTLNLCFKGIFVFPFDYFQLFFLIKSFPSPLHFIHHSQTPISPKSILPLSLLSLITQPQHRHLQQATILTL